MTLFHSWPIASILLRRTSEFGQTSDLRINSFDSIADTIERFTEIIGLYRFVGYVFDYGAPTGFRLAIRNLVRIASKIPQNGNTYVEGLIDS